MRSTELINQPAGGSEAGTFAPLCPERRRELFYGKYALHSERLNRYRSGNMQMMNLVQRYYTLESRAGK